MTCTDANLRSVWILLGALALVLGLSLGRAESVSAQSESPDFTVSPAAPVAGESVTFTATGVRQRDTVMWDFESDGRFDATGTTVQHVYRTAGRHTVLMRAARPDGGQRRDVTKIVTVGAPPPPPGSPPESPPESPPNHPPVASFNFYPREPLSGDRVEFVSTSSDAESSVAQHAWDLDGDGQFDDSSGVTAARSFGAPGRYTIALRVTDARGAADVESVTITVRARVVSSSGLGLMSPFPVVRIIGRSTLSGARIKLLTVRGAPRGATVTVRCRGDGCGRRRQSKIVGSRRVRFRAFERALRTGARLQIFVTRRGSIGKYTSFKIRWRRPPLRRDLCVTSVRAKPKECPSL